MTITIPDDHSNPTDCQLILVITGSNSFIGKTLNEIVLGLIREQKPQQGTQIHGNGTISIITPTWKGKTA